MSIVLPLGKPENESVSQRKTDKVARGVTVNLHVTDGKDGQVNIAWDPLKKGQKTVEEDLSGAKNNQQPKTVE